MNVICCNLVAPWDHMTACMVQLSLHLQAAQFTLSSRLNGCLCLGIYWTAVQKECQRLPTDPCGKTGKTLFHSAEESARHSQLLESVLDSMNEALISKEVAEVLAACKINSLPSFAYQIFSQLPQCRALMLLVLFSSLGPNLLWTRESTCVKHHTWEVYEVHEDLEKGHHERVCNICCQTI